jgi:dipeptidyl aminopeptidase/acylaminoacyl peptidase
MKLSTASLAIVVALSLVSESARAQGRRGQEPVQGVYKARVTVNWFHDGAKFWYRNQLRGGTREFIVVDTNAGTRNPAFDHARLATALSQAASKQYTGDKLPFEAIELVNDDKAIRFKVGDDTWECDLGSYQCAKTDAAMASPQVTDGDGPGAGTRGRGGGGRGGGGRGNRSMRSPDAKWTAQIKDFNVYIHNEADNSDVQLTTDGKEGFAYGRLEWAPDSSTLVAFRIEPGERKEVYRIQSSPPNGGRAVLQQSEYALPGDKFDSLELNLFNIEARKQIKPNVDRIDFGGWGNPNPTLRWSKDQHHFTYEKIDRGHQRFRLIEVDAHTGETRNIIDEKTSTFIWTAHTEAVGTPMVTWLEKSDQIIYMSERDGWRHLYLVDVPTGNIKPIMQGEYVLRGIDRIDEDKQQIWFRACGKNPGQDPYFIHYYRINFDGSGLVALTEGNGSHSAQFSEDRSFIVDTYSRVDSPPVHELRRTSDGSLVCKLEEADISELQSEGWQPPEVFVAKGRDGKTDIWGIINRPRNFDSSKKYPVLEQIYNGPQSAYVPKTFSGQRRFSNLTDLGFIVVQMDAMGTAFRSKAFHDVCWHNLADAGFPDRIAWHKAAGAKYSYYDTERVGIYGNSAGGQNAAAAVIFHPEFYKAAVANSGCHDNRMDKSSWNEQWMGYPVGEQYSRCSNIDNAAKLGAFLMIIIPELDTNVPPESSFRLVDALVKARKDFDVVVIPGANHGAQSPITQRRLQDFFVRHLQGIDAPNRNASPAAG